MSESILNVKVGEPLELNLARAAQTMEALERGESPTPYSEIVVDVRMPQRRAA